MVAGSARHWIAVHAVNNPNLNKTDNKKYDNSTPKKFNKPIAFAARSAFHPARALLLCACAASASGRHDHNLDRHEWRLVQRNELEQWSTQFFEGRPYQQRRQGVDCQLGRAAHSLILGQYYQDSGEVDAGTSADLNVSSAIYVGSLGTGTLNISNGASVESLIGYIAASAVAPASVGSVTVTGSNSKWNVGRINFLSSRLFVSGTENGDGGTGLLSITNGGAVIVTNNNSYASVTVGPSGTVTGNGTLATTSEPTVFVKGTLAPSSGTLSIGGSLSTSNLSLLNTAVTACNVTPSAADNVAISGTAALDGRLSVTMTGTFTCTTMRYTLLHSAGVRSGTFLSVSINYPTNQGFVPHITYDGNYVYLDLVFNNPC